MSDPYRTPKTPAGDAMMPGPNSTIVVAPNHPWAVHWCQDQNPPINPRSVVILTGSHDVRRLMGMKLENRRVIILGWPEHVRDYNALRDALRSRGWPTLGEGADGG